MKFLISAVIFISMFQMLVCQDNGIKFSAQYTYNNATSINPSTTPSTTFSKTTSTTPSKSPLTTPLTTSLATILTTSLATLETLQLILVELRSLSIAVLDLKNALPCKPYDDSPNHPSSKEWPSIPHGPWKPSASHQTYSPNHPPSNKWHASLPNGHQTFGPFLPHGPWKPYQTFGPNHPPSNEWPSVHNGLWKPFAPHHTFKQNHPAHNSPSSEQFGPHHSMLGGLSNSLSLIYGWLGSSLVPLIQALSSMANPQPQPPPTSFNFLSLIDALFKMDLMSSLNTFLNSLSSFFTGNASALSNPTTTPPTTFPPPTPTPTTTTTPPNTTPRTTTPTITSPLTTTPTTTTTPPNTTPTTTSPPPTTTPTTAIPSNMSKSPTLNSGPSPASANTTASTGSTTLIQPTQPILINSVLTLINQLLGNSTTV